MDWNMEGDKRVKAGEAQEGKITSYVESYTSKVPSGLFLAAALGSMVASVSFKIAKKDHAALFVGQWAAPFLIMGIYNKQVKQHGSDATQR